MAVSEVFSPISGMIGGGLSSWMQYAWVLFGAVFLFIIIGVVWIWKSVQKKKTQWTHKLKVRRVLQNGLLSDTTIHLMRRFPLIKKAEVFELEKPLLGGYLIPELDQYSGVNEYSIILDNNNRIYTNLGEFFNPDSKSVNVSAKHSEIDVMRQTLKADFQNINKTSKRIEWATIAKYALIFVAIVALSIVTISGMGKWGEAQQYKAQSDMAQASAMENLATAMGTIEATVNTQQLEIKYMLQELYGTKNIQAVINSRITNGTA